MCVVCEWILCLVIGWCDGEMLKKFEIFDVRAWIMFVEVSETFRVGERVFFVGDVVYWFLFLGGFGMNIGI